MKGISPNITKESPKTPGGISKALLTPCRRVGLSRKWRKIGCSQFISPLGAKNATPEKTGDREDKTKTQNCTDLNNETGKDQLHSVHVSSLDSPLCRNDSEINNDITSTPCRNTQIPRQKSKLFSLTLKNCQDPEKNELASEKELLNNKSLNLKEFQRNKMNLFENETVGVKSDEVQNNISIVLDNAKPSRQIPQENISILVRTDSKCKKLSLKKSHSKSECNTELKNININKSHDNPKSKERSPNKLTKECIVVIQNKLLKIDSNTTIKRSEKASQESDSEPDTPLSALKKEYTENVSLNLLNDDDIINKPVKKKYRKLSTIKTKNQNSAEYTNNSQSSQEDVDKKTILVKKSYEKVPKLQKAKSTGSITQKDIDDLKARVEMKKKLLLAKAMSIDTDELRSLIKKWQRGCQDALIELLDLMKKKLPERQNMDYAEILESLKIPAELVGYDSENDCFITPNDTNVLLSTFKL